MKLRRETMFNRTLGIFISLILFFIAVPSHAVTPKGPVWPALKTNYFGDKIVREQSSDLLTIEAPKRAEDAAIVPISIKSLVPQTADKYIKNIHIIIDNNPIPYSANFHLSPELGLINISTRMRFDQNTFVRAIAEMNDGSLHMVSRFVKASGGCSAPSAKDAAAALARLGKMKIRMRGIPTVGRELQVQVIVGHPNYNGLQFDPQSRSYIEAHYVKNIAINYNGEPLISVDTGISVSEDPSVRFTFTPTETGVLEAQVIDSKDQRFSSQKEI
jgi:sulfur-oxidizing protein SoxY